MRAIPHLKAVSWISSVVLLYLVLNFMWYGPFVLTDSYEKLFSYQTVWQQQTSVQYSASLMQKTKLPSTIQAVMTKFVRLKISWRRVLKTWEISRSLEISGFSSRGDISIWLTSTGQQSIRFVLRPQNSLKLGFNYSYNLQRSIFSSGEG